MNARIIPCLLVFGTLVVIPVAFGQTGGDYELVWSTIDGGGLLRIGGG